MDYELTPVDDAVLALSLFGVTDEDQCRRLLSMWARVGSLTPDEQEQVVRAVTCGHLCYRHEVGPIVRD